MGHARAIGFNLALVGLGLLVLWLLYALVRGEALPEADAPASEEQDALPDGDIPQVDIRNGAGIAGLAEAMRIYLRSQGYDVVEVGNHTSFDEPETIILDRVGNPGIARRLAATLDLPEERVREDIRQDYFLDASVIIGRDYESHPPFSLEDDQ